LLERSWRLKFWWWEEDSTQKSDGEPEANIYITEKAEVALQTYTPFGIQLGDTWVWQAKGKSSHRIGFVHLVVH